MSSSVWTYFSKPGNQKLLSWLGAARWSPPAESGRS